MARDLTVAQCVLRGSFPAGLSLRAALRARNYWSGGWAAGTLLVPYSVCVETVSQGVKAALGHSALGQASAWLATTIPATFGMQIIEKKLVMDQMLQERGGGGSGGSGGSSGGSGGGGSGSGSAARWARAARARAWARPVLELAAYTHEFGARRLFAGTAPLFVREGIYIFAVSTGTPALAALLLAPAGGGEGGGREAWRDGAALAFGVGLLAGVVSAPAQTLSAMLKYDGGPATLRAALREIYAPGWAGGTRRIFYGSATRALRVGGAGVLYYSYRRLYQNLGDPDDGDLDR